MAYTLIHSVIGSYLGSSSSGLHWERLEHPGLASQLPPVSGISASQVRPECSCFHIAFKCRFKEVNVSSIFNFRAGPHGL